MMQVMAPFLTLDLRGHGLDREMQSRDASCARTVVARKPIHDGSCAGAPAGAGAGARAQTMVQRAS